MAWNKQLMCVHKTCACNKSNSVPYQGANYNYFLPYVVNARFKSIIKFGS